MDDISLGTSIHSLDTGTSGGVDERGEDGKQDVQKDLKPSTFGLVRNYSTIDISADKWLMVNDPVSLDKLENPPSLADGLSVEMEKSLRYLGCELIQLGAILLKLPQTAAATGQILFHRYYYQKSFVRYNFQHTVMACLLLASKIEEDSRRPRDVINVYHRLKQLHMRRGAKAAGETEHKRLEPMLLDRTYVELKNLVIKAERRILNVLGFVVHVHHPHKLIHVYLHTLSLLDSEELLQKAWSYMNDSLRTDIFLRYKPETIACACIYLAARTVDKPVVLPSQPFPWFELFDASDRDVKSIAATIIQLYSVKEVPNLKRMAAHVDKLQQQMHEREKKANGEKSDIIAKGQADVEDLIRKLKTQRGGGESERAHTDRGSAERGKKIPAVYDEKLPDRERWRGREERRSGRDRDHDQRARRDESGEQSRVRDRDYDRGREKDYDRKRERSPPRRSEPSRHRPSDSHGGREEHRHHHHKRRRRE